jgi:hypothetical protein
VFGRDEHVSFACHSMFRVQISAGAFQSINDCFVSFLDFDAHAFVICDVLVFLPAKIRVLF